jgi:EmrB/QacA subfamily drug resistance transporter
VSARRRTRDPSNGEDPDPARFDGDGAGEGAAPEPLTRREILLVFSGLMLAMLLAALDSTIVATALPTIVGEFGGLERLGWVVTAYLLAQTIVTPLYGKLGDLYGRKIVLQSGIVIFLLGSVLCGMSGSMGQLILFRFIQGLGGGGLMVTAQAVIGDIVTPRERGRYQGIFGAVFGVASIAGPLLGGYFTTHLSWRWIFYINLPLGLLALFVIATRLPPRARRVHHAIDYAGSGLLAVALSAIVLVTDLAGVTYSWTSAPILGLAALAVVSLCGFVFAQSRAAEPVLPLRLFRNRTFAVTSAIGLIVGFAMFGSVTYLPLFLQVVNGASPTGSGLQMIPMMAGMLLTSISSGQVISRTGRYRVFPKVGTAVMALGLVLLSRMHAETGIIAASANMLVLGLGLGLVMQVLVIAVQNAVPYRDLGVATSGATLFRLIGGSVGTAVFGAIFATRLASHLADAGLLPGAGGPSTGISREMIESLPPDVRAIYVDAFTASLGTVFLAAAVVAVIGFVLTWLVPEHPLRETIAAVAGDVGRETEDLFPLPTDAGSVFRLERALSLVASRDVKRAYIARVVARAGLDLGPAAAWLLVRIAGDADLDVATLARRRRVDPAILSRAAEELVSRGLVQQRGVSTDAAGFTRNVTPAGRDALARLRAARRAHLEEVLAEGAGEQDPTLDAALRRLSRDLVRDPAG